MSEIVNILNTKIYNVNYDAILEIINRAITKKEKISIHYANSHILLLNLSNQKFSEYLENITYFFPDGIGVYLASKFLYGKSGLKSKITGTDLYFQLIKNSTNTNTTFFFYGGSTKAISKLEEKLKTGQLQIKVVGYKSRDFSNYDEIVQIINAAKPDILLVGLGSPFQEEFLSKYSKSLEVAVILLVGSGIDFIANTLRRAPKFMRRIGLEWLFRLAIEPKRLWKRYIIGIPKFVISIINQKLNNANSKAEFS